MALFGQESLILNLKNWLILNKFKIFCLFACTITFYVFLCLHKPAPMIPDHLQKYLNIPANGTVVKIQNLADKLEKLNGEHEVRNSETFGPVDADTLIVVITAHQDLRSLRFLIISLAQVQHISSTLLIFSHSYYDENINYLIRLIDFCMVLQIYYPNSVQVFPNVFPGYSKDNELSLRNASEAERKHHWWWTAHVVFEELPWAKTHKEMVIFIEENSYVLPDCLYMFQFAKRSLSYIPDANVLSFGRSLANDLEYNKLTVDGWRPPYDKGLAFNITTWRIISSLREHFCEYDDTSWSYSLLRLFEKFPRGRALMVACMAPRVVSTSIFRSGWHAMVYLHFTVDSQLLFPDSVNTVVLFGRNGKVLRNTKAPQNGNGGWMDNRDRIMCLDPLTVTETVNDLTTTIPIFTTETFTE